MYVKEKMVTLRSHKEQEDTTSTKNNNDHDEENETIKTKNTRKKMDIKESKSKRKAELRRKNMGLGIGNIDVNASSSNKGKKIRFDNHSDDDDGSVGDHDIVDDNDNQKLEEEKEEESDDEVEQVSAAVAKEKSLQIRAAEREIRKVENSMTQKRKKKVTKEEHLDDEDDELDEDFFAMVDTARENDSKVKKLKQESIISAKKLGRHTTFVSEDKNLANNIVQADHNIEVVILPSSREDDIEDNQNINDVLHEKAAATLSSDLSSEPSKTAMLFCRGHSRNSNVSQSGQKQVFRRSRQIKYKLSLGKPAANFAVKKKSRD